MRINFRLKFGTYTFFGMISKTQRLEGITSKIVDDKEKKHYVFWDIENCTLKECENELKDVQYKYDLSDIFITSDIEKSFRAWCFTKVSFRKLIQIICDTKYVDWNFIHWTVVRGSATLRISNKQNRKKQELVSVLPSYSVPMPTQLEDVIYDTGCDKIGKNIILGK